MREVTKKSKVRKRSDLSLNDISRWYNPIIRGWINYYGKYSRSALYPVWRHLNQSLVAWAMRKYKPLRRRKIRASKFIQRIAMKQPNLFVHWKEGMLGSFA